MMYTEENDFLEKSKAIEEFRSRLVRHGVALQFSSAVALEVGGSGGVFGGILSNDLRRIIVSDIVDTNSQYQGQFGRLLKEKFERNGRELNLEKIEFHVADAMNLPYRDQLFDLAVSQNAFEHIPDPLLALDELLRVVKKGGVIYLTFDPIWTSDTGSHFSHFVPEPWSHLLLDEETFCKNMRAAGAHDNEVEEFRLAMNRKDLNVYLQQFQSMLRSHDVSFAHHQTWTGCADASHLTHSNRFEAAARLGCEPDELLVRGISYLIVR